MVNSCSTTTTALITWRFSREIKYSCNVWHSITHYKFKMKNDKKLLLFIFFHWMSKNHKKETLKTFLMYVYRIILYFGLIYITSRIKRVIVLCYFCVILAALACWLLRSLSQSLYSKRIQSQIKLKNTKIPEHWRQNMYIQILCKKWI